MKFDINYEYDEKYLPNKRCRKEENRAVKDICQVDIREITDEKDFPVALRVTDYGITPQKEHEYKPGTIDIRYFEGKCWKEWRIPSGTGIHELIPIDELGSEIEYKSRSFSEHVYENDERPYVEGVSVITADTREQCIRNIISMAKDYLIFDGKVWVLSSLPYYGIMTYGLGHNHGGTSLLIQWTSYDTIGYDDYLADQKEQAFAHAIKVAEGRGDTEYVPEIKESPLNIEVLIPEAYTLKRNLASIDLPDYNWDDEKRVFVREYEKPGTPHYDKWTVRFDYKYDDYLAKFCTEWKFAHTAAENIRQIIGQLLIDVPDMPAKAIHEIHNVTKDEYYDLNGNLI